MAKKPAPKPAPKTAPKTANTPAKKPAAKQKTKSAGPKRDHRPQIADELGLDEDDNRPLVINPLTNLDNPINNPDDIEVDEAAIAQGPTHGGTLETRSQELRIRGRGGRKRSGPRTKGPGRDRTKKR
jgi:hypothetical protein